MILLIRRSISQKFMDQLCRSCGWNSPKAAEEGVYAVIAVGAMVRWMKLGTYSYRYNHGHCSQRIGQWIGRHLQIPWNPKKALEVINESLVETIDYGLINKVPFFALVGWDSTLLLASKFAKAGKEDYLHYLEKTLQESLTYQPETYELETEDGMEKHKAS